MKWRRRPLKVVQEPPEQPWMDKQFVVNDKPTTLRIIRRFAMDMSEADYRNDAERGLAMTIVALVDELSWVHAQLADAQLSVEPTREEA